MFVNSYVMFTMYYSILKEKLLEILCVVECIQNKTEAGAVRARGVGADKAAGPKECRG
jgi:hypothetical protein